MAPTTIGRYEIRSHLGAGGMATVYQAYDPQMEREVAIKVLPSESTGREDLLVRFRREARTITSLEHAAIVPVYDYGEADGQPYLVMRLMPGGSLRDRLARGLLPISEIAHLYKRLASALDYAHGKGVIHRDLKPGNILFDQQGEPFLADFGIVRLTDKTTTLTQGVIGTPAYMSPEQGLAKPDLNYRTDIYALGAMLFELLTGRVPYEAETPTAQLLLHITEPIPDLRDFRPDLPADCQTILALAMAKDPGVRYATVGALAADLEKLAAGKPVQSYQPTLGRIASTGAVSGGTPRPAAARLSGQPRTLLLIAGGLSLCLILMIVGVASGLIALNQNGSGPFAAAATPTSTVSPVPTQTSAPPVPSKTADPVILPSVTPTASPVLPTATITPLPTPTTWLGVLDVRAPTLNEIRDEKLSIWNANLLEVLDILEPDVKNWRGTASIGQEYTWFFKWCTLTPELLENNLENMDVRFYVNNLQVPAEAVDSYKFDLLSGWKCNYWNTVIGGWASGASYELTLTYTITRQISDGQLSYPPGDYTHHLVITVP